MKPVVALGLALWLAVGPIASAYAQCDSTISNKLRELGVDETRIASMQTRRNSTIEGLVQDYTAWIRLKDCKGYLVIDVTRSCGFIQAYTQGACQVSGVKSY